MSSADERINLDLAAGRVKMQEAVEKLDPDMRLELSVMEQAFRTFEEVKLDAKADVPHEERERREFRLYLMTILRNQETMSRVQNFQFFKLYDMMEEIQAQLDEIHDSAEDRDGAIEKCLDRLNTIFVKVMGYQPPEDGNGNHPFERED